MSRSISHTKRLMWTTFAFLAVSTALVAQPTFATRQATKETAQNSNQGTNPGASVDAPVAQTTTEPRGKTTSDVALFDQRTTPDGKTFSFDLVIDAPEGARVVATVYQRVANRDAFNENTNGRGLGSVIGFVATSVPTAPPGQAVFKTVSLSVGPAGSCATCIDLLRKGVYPVAIELRRTTSDETTDRFVTFVSYNPTATTNPLRVAVIVPIHADQSAQVSATKQSSTPRSVINAIEALTQVPDIPLTIDASPQVIDQLASVNRPVLALLKASVNQREFVRASYVHISSPLLDSATLRDRIVNLFELGDRIIESHVGVRTVPDLLIEPEVIPDDTLLDALGIGSLISSAETLTESTSAPNRLGPVVVDPGARSNRETRTRLVQLIDRTVSERLARVVAPDSSTNDEQLQARHALSELELIALSDDAPNRGIAIVVPERVQRGTLEALLVGLRNNPRVTAIRASELFTNGLTGDDTLYTPRSMTLSNEQLRDRDEVAKTFLELTRQADAYQSLFGPEGVNDPSIRRELDEVLRESAVTLDTQGVPEVRRGQVEEVRALLGAKLGSVANETSRRITLTGREQQIPISLVNDTGHRISLRLIVETDNAVLPDGRRLSASRGIQREERSIAIDGRVSQQFVRVGTRGPGRYSLVITLVAPNGVELAKNRYLIQATAIGALGKVLTISALAFLAMWWTASVIRGRTGRQRSHNRTSRDNSQRNEAPS